MKCMTNVAFYYIRTVTTGLRLLQSMKIPKSNVWAQ